MRLICDVCSSPPGDEGQPGQGSGELVESGVVSFSRYEDWTVHLLSKCHEQNMKVKLVDRVRTTEDMNGYVVTFTKSKDGRYPNRLKLLEFFGARGFVAQYYFDDTARFCFVRVDSMFVGSYALREGDYLVDDGHRVTCIKAKGTSDVYWSCLLQRKASKKGLLPPPIITNPGDTAELNQRNSNDALHLPVNGEDGGKTEVLLGKDAKTNKKKRSSPCLFDTRQICGTNQNIDNIGILNGFSPVSFTATGTRPQTPNQNLQHMGIPPSCQPVNFNNMQRPPYPPTVTLYPAPGGGGNGDFRHMIPYPHPSSPFYLSTNPNQQQQYQQGPYYHPVQPSFYPYPTPPPPSPSTPNVPGAAPQQTQLQLNNGNNTNFKMMPQQNYPIMLQPQGPQPMSGPGPRPPFMQGAPMVLPPPPPGFRPLQTLYPRVNDNCGSSTGTCSSDSDCTKTNPVGISFLSGINSGGPDEDFLKKIQQAFGTNAVSFGVGCRPPNLSAPPNPATSVLQFNNNLENGKSSVSSNLPSNRLPVSPSTEQEQRDELQIKSNILEQLLLPPDLSEDDSDTDLNPVMQTQSDKENAKNNTSVKSRYSSLFSTFKIRPNAGKASKDGKSFQKLPLSEQIFEFIAAQGLSGPEMQRRRQVLSDLATLMQQYKDYSACRVYPFGSYLTGLGDSSSDLDVYLDAFNLYSGDSGRGEQKHSFLNVLNTTAKRLREAKTAEHVWLCRSVNAIRSARVPIVQFTHSNGVQCDISFDNMLALRNSQLVALYIALHPCVRPLLVLVRYWAKFHGLVGSMLIKNYCIVLMVLTFLGKLGVIPSVDKLRWLVGELRRREGIDRNPDIHNGWDSSFCNNIDEINAFFPSRIDHQHYTKNAAELVLRLFGDFCGFYSNFNPSKDVVCPLVMDFVPKSCFLAGNEAQLPPVFDPFKRWAQVATVNGSRSNFKLNTSMCIQDPFMLSYNTAVLTSAKTLLLFQAACHQTAVRIKDPNREINSLFDIFVTLPSALQDRRFLQNYQNSIKATELVEEITGFVEKGTKHFQRVLENQDPSSMKLNLHQFSSDEINKCKARLAASKKSSNITVFRPSKKFRAMFSQVFTGHSGEKGNEKETKELERKMRLFWIRVAEEFLSIFWSKCFALNVEKSQCVRRDFGLETELEEEDEDNENGEGGTQAEVGEGDLGDQDEKPDGSEDENENVSPTKQTPQLVQVSKLLGSFTHLRREENVIKKLDEIEEMEQSLVYMRLICSTMSFVWENRDAILLQQKASQTEKNKKANSESTSAPTQPDNDSDTEVKSTSKKVSNRQKKKVQKAKKLPFEETYDQDPLEIQSKVTQVIVNNHPIQVSKVDGRPIQLLGFNVLIKFDKRWVNENPALYLIFEKNPAVPCDKIFKEAINTITSVLNNVFPSYAFHCALKWLNNNGALTKKGGGGTGGSDKNKTEIGAGDRVRGRSGNGQSLPCTTDLNQFPSLS